VLRALSVILYMLLSVSGIVLVKAGAGATMLGFSGGILQMRAGWQTIAGLCCYVASFLMLMGILGQYDLSYIVPLTTGIIQILILLAAVFFFRERISILNLVGIFVVIAGVILMNLKDAKVSP